MIRVHSVGPYRGLELYWGIEWDVPAIDRKVISTAWLIEDLPPFRRSDWGCRIRIGSRALHLGKCHRGEDPHRRDVAPLSEISKWRGSAADQEQAAGGDAGGEPVRHDEHREPQGDAGSLSR